MGVAEYRRGGVEEYGSRCGGGQRDEGGREREREVARSQ